MDGIRPLELKNNASYLTPILTKFINLSLENGIIPGILKTSDYNNYRPIAMLPAVEKFLEEVVVRRLTSFGETSQISSITA